MTDIILILLEPNVDLEEVEHIFGGPLVPLCSRQIPCKGTE